MENAINAPKLATFNQQKRGDGMESPNFSHDSMAIQNAKNSHNIAQKLHNDNVRGTGDVPHTSINDMSMEKALNAPKVDLQSPQVRGTGEKPNFNTIL